MDTAVVEMILRSGWVARLILLVLAALTIVSWAIIFSRGVLFAQVKRQGRLFSKKFISFKNFSELSGGEGKLKALPHFQIAITGAQEYERVVSDARAHGNVNDWSFFLQNQFAMADSKLEAQVANKTAQLESGLSLLAIISSLSPFLGLLGTVWGIMNSFYQIGSQGSASLPVVAPGIAEALITTIIGLFVAIPALFFYNLYSHRLGRFEDELVEHKENVFLLLKQSIFSMLYKSKGVQ